MEQWWEGSTSTASDVGQYSKLGDIIFRAALPYVSVKKNLHAFFFSKGKWQIDILVFVQQQITSHALQDKADIHILS